MDKREAKEILWLYRPGAPENQDPSITEALKVVKDDPELSRWFEEHCRFYVAMQGELKAVPVPADLKKKILDAEAMRRGKIVQLRRTFVPLATAAAMALVALGTWWLIGRGENFAGYRERLVKQTQRGYAMSMTSTNLEDIHAFLMAKQCPDYVLTQPLAKLRGEGCTTLELHGRKVSMVCLYAGRGRDLFLFVMDRTKLNNTPAEGERRFSKIRELETASWSAGDKVYILAGPVDEAQLKVYLD